MMTVWPLILLLWTFLHKHTFFSQLRRLWLLHFISWENKTEGVWRCSLTGQHLSLANRQERERETDSYCNFITWMCYGLEVVLLFYSVYFIGLLYSMILCMFVYSLNAFIFFFFCLLPILIKEMIHTCSFCIKDGRWVQSQIMYSSDTSIKRAQLQQSNRTNRMDRPDRPDRC